MKYHILKVCRILSWKEFPKSEIEESSIDGDLYDLIEYLTRGLRRSKKIYFVVSLSEEPIVKFKKLVFVKGLSEGIEKTMYYYLSGITTHLEILLAREISEDYKNYFDEHYPGLLKIKNYIAMAEFAGYSSGSGSENWISLFCIKNGRVLGICTVKAPRGRMKAPREVEFRHFEINLKYSRKKFPVEYMRGIYTSEELIKFLRLLLETG